MTLASLGEVHHWIQWLGRYSRLVVMGDRSKLHTSRASLKGVCTRQLKVHFVGKYCMYGLWFISLIFFTR
jgi:hypothetical protein